MALQFITFYWAGFTVPQRDRAQEDCKVLYEGDPAYPPHPPMFSLLGDEGG